MVGRRSGEPDGHYVKVSVNNPRHHKSFGTGVYCKNDARSGVRVLMLQNHTLTQLANHWTGI
tara:strand:- start:25691 stop:25876 length:186 start_codon:yes stop_codon:yes gene_type:complete